MLEREVSSAPDVLTFLHEALLDARRVDCALLRIIACGGGGTASITTSRH